MKPNVQRVHSALRMAVTAFAIVCLLSLAAIPFSSSAHAATNTHGTSVVSQATTNNHKVAMQAVGTVHGCPSGYACIYPQDAGWNGDHPSQTWYSYGTYQLSNQYGNHYIYNNQTGGAPFWLCTDWKGNTCPSYVAAGAAAQTDFTPINSVKLVPSL